MILLWSQTQGFAGAPKWRTQNRRVLSNKNIMIMSIEINNDLLAAIIGVLSALIVAMITFMGVWYQLKKNRS